LALDLAVAARILAAMDIAGNSEWLWLEDVASMTRAPLSTVRFWCAQGKRESIRPGRRRMVHRQALARFLAQEPSPTVRKDHH
jgi:excisionase family DNA binding protein